MSLLFDANLSPKLVRRFDDVFPGSRHVFEFGIQNSDGLIWEFAVAHGLTIVTKDDDFESKALFLAPPGKVILIKLGNCRSATVERLFREELEWIRAFLNSPSDTLLALP